MLFGFELSQVVFLHFSGVYREKYSFLIVFGCTNAGCALDLLCKFFHNWNESTCGYESNTVDIGFF